jgi:hypothetical protein
MIKQGQEQKIPARIRSTTDFSNGVTNITIACNNINNNSYDIASATQVICVFLNMKTKHHIYDGSFSMNTFRYT